MEGYVCSVCGHYNLAFAGSRHRELGACERCGSNMRFRAIACAVTRAVLGRVGVLHEMPVDRSVRALGLEDARAYAQLLERKLDYTNTSRGGPPRLDLDDDAPFAGFEPVDLIVCSDILEHTRRTPAQALHLLAGALRPGGHLVLSVPSYEMPDTIERYPSLASFSVEPRPAGGFCVRYRTSFGTEGLDEAPVFHGAPGQQTELRLIAHPQLLREVVAAGLELLPTLDAALALHDAQWPSMVERSDVPMPMNGGVILARRPPA